MSDFFLEYLKIPEEKYQEILSLVPIVCVDVAIIRDTKVLLIRRKEEPMAGCWWLPGGRLFKGEMLENCALRKAMGETGLPCEIGPLIHCQSTEFDTVHSVNLVYILHAKHDTVSLDDTSSDYKWIDWDNLDGEYHPYINAALRKLNHWYKYNFLGPI